MQAGQARRNGVCSKQQTHLCCGPSKGNVDRAEREDASSAERVKRYCSKECERADGRRCCWRSSKEMQEGGQRPFWLTDRNRKARALGDKMSSSLPG